MARAATNRSRRVSRTKEAAGYLSMTKSGFFGGSRFCGFDNHSRLLSDPEVLGAFRSRLSYVDAFLRVPLLHMFTVNTG